MKKFLLSCFFLFLILSYLYSQNKLNKKPVLKVKTNYILFEGDTLNRVDKNGFRDGRWIEYKIIASYEKLNEIHYSEDTNAIDDIVSLPWWMDSVFFNKEDIFISEKMNYSNGKKIGIWKGFFENGNIRYKANFKKDTLIKALFYKDNGRRNFLLKRVKNDNKRYLVKDKYNGNYYITKDELFNYFEW